MDTREVIARFEAERQALAMMDHPNIAKVLDVGTTEKGRPHFVMELVKGLPITQYCDDNHLTPKQRLELYVPICKANPCKIRSDLNPAKPELTRTSVVGQIWLRKLRPDI